MKNLIFVDTFCQAGKLFLKVMLMKTEDKIEITTKEIDFLINSFNLNNSD